MRNVLIIGGSSGIGRSCVQMFHDKGWNVYGTFFSHGGNLRVSENIFWSFLDINDVNLQKEYIKTLPLVDAVIMCVGLNRKNSMPFSKNETLDEVFNTNIINQIHFIDIIQKKLKINSSIVFFGSITGHKGSERRIAYSASKASMYGLVPSLAATLSPKTRVNAVFPGYIKTSQYLKNSTISLTERKKNILLRRLGKPEEVARLVYFLSSEESSYINAQCININGGVL